MSPYRPPITILTSEREPDCEPWLVVDSINMENPPLIPGTLLVRPTQHKPGENLNLFSFLQKFSETLVVDPRWSQNQELQRIGNLVWLPEFSQKRKPSSLCKWEARGTPNIGEVKAWTLENFTLSPLFSDSGG